MRCLQLQLTVNLVQAPELTHLHKNDMPVQAPKAALPHNDENAGAGAESGSLHNDDNAGAGAKSGSPAQWWYPVMNC